MQTRVGTGRSQVTLEGSTKLGNATRSQRQGGKFLQTHTRTARTHSQRVRCPLLHLVNVFCFPRKNKMGLVWICCVRFSVCPQILGPRIVWQRFLFPSTPSKVGGCFLLFIAIFLPCLVGTGCSLRVMPLFWKKTCPFRGACVCVYTAFLHRHCVWCHLYKPQMA